MVHDARGTVDSWLDAVVLAKCIVSTGLVHKASNRVLYMWSLMDRATLILPMAGCET